MRAPMTRGDPPSVDVWFLDRRVEPTRSWSEVLEPEERARAEAFRTPELQARYVAAHALVRTVLSTYAPVRPADWRYAHGPRGQPTLVGAPLDLRFSLSHSGAHAAVAVTVGRPVGFDLEEVDAGKDALAIAERFFTAAETEALRSCRNSEQASRLATLWTVKEAVLKARGVGLASGLGDVAVALEGERVRSVVAPGGPWSVRAWAVEPGLRAAVVVASESGLGVRTFRAIPLGAVQGAPELGPPG